MDGGMGSSSSYSDLEGDSFALVSVGEEYSNMVNNVPIVSSFNDRIRPLLDAVDKLRHLKVMKEGIQLPTTVVVGNQSSGKSSVPESLAGTSLPRGQTDPGEIKYIERMLLQTFH